MRRITKIIIHCSDSDITGQSAAMISSWHKERGWEKIGYSYFIQTTGKLEKGRGPFEVGAHCKGHNADSIGICLAGKKYFSNYQFDALKMLLELLKISFPDAELYGHNELDKDGKTCPNFNLVTWKEFWKSLSACTTT